MGRGGLRPRSLRRAHPFRREHPASRRPRVGALTMQDRPTVLELLAAVRGFLEDDLGPVLEGRRRFHALVAANVLRIVERELRRRGGAARTAVGSPRRAPRSRRFEQAAGAERAPDRGAGAGDAARRADPRRRRRRSGVRRPGAGPRPGDGGGEAGRREPALRRRDAGMRSRVSRPGRAAGARGCGGAACGALRPRSAGCVRG